MKKSINTLLGIALILPLLSFISFDNDITSIRWTSDQYKDLETGDLIQMSNEFEGTPNDLSWSLFGGELPVSRVEWKLNESDQGSITYYIAGNNLNGTVTFSLGASLKAETDIKSDVGRLRFRFDFAEEQQAIFGQEPASLSMEKNK